MFVMDRLWVGELQLPCRDLVPCARGEKKERKGSLVVARHTVRVFFDVLLLPLNDDDRSTEISPRLCTISQ